jgi:hypothetical protein
MECPPGGRCGLGSDTVTARRATVGGFSKREWGVYLATVGTRVGHRWGALHGHGQMAPYRGRRQSEDPSLPSPSRQENPGRLAWMRSRHPRDPLVTTDTADRAYQPLTTGLVVEHLASAACSIDSPIGIRRRISSRSSGSLGPFASSARSSPSRRDNHEASQLPLET